jgi:membrane-associated phospholipid phosphatase
MFYYAINAIGAFGPQISLFLSLLYLRKKPTLIIIYSFGFILNSLLVYVLKGLFQQPRPTDETTSFNLEQIYRKKPGFSRFGMPSGHTQLVFYSSAFLYCALRDGNTNIIMALLSLITAYQRIESRHHTLAQVVVGAIVGSLVGCTFFKYGEKQVKGLLKEKNDDNVKRLA